MQSKFIVSLWEWILMASNTLLFQYSCLFSTILALSQSMRWSYWWMCTAIPLFSSNLLTTSCLCSASHTLSVLLVSPTYTWLQSWQGTSYATPVFLSSEILFFTFTQVCLMVVCVLEINIKLTDLMFLRTLSVFSVNPLTNGKHRILFSFVMFAMF